MADDNQKRTPPPTGVPAPQQRPSSPAREEEAPAPERPLNETVPGGRYIVNGQTVDAEGRPLPS